MMVNVGTFTRQVNLLINVINVNLHYFLAALFTF